VSLNATVVCFPPNSFAVVNTGLLVVLLLLTLQLTAIHGTVQHHEWILAAETPTRASSIMPILCMMTCALPVQSLLTPL
jgi:hypothetical protein